MFLILFHPDFAFIVILSIITYMTSFSFAHIIIHACKKSSLIVHNKMKRGVEDFLSQQASFPQGHLKIE